jgi:hypothetical protein
MHNAYMHSCIHAFMHTHKCMHAYIHTCIHTGIRTRQGTCEEHHAYIHTYVPHTYIRTSIEVCSCQGATMVVTRREALLDMLRDPLWVASTTFQHIPKVRPVLHSAILTPFELHRFHGVLHAHAENDVILTEVRKRQCPSTFMLYIYYIMTFENVCLEPKHLP